MDSEKTISLDTELAVLYTFIEGGEANATPRQELASMMGVNERSLRAKIEKLRREGYVIAASDRGYFRPETADELQRYIARMEKHAKSTFANIKTAKDTLREMVTPYVQIQITDAV